MPSSTKQAVEYIEEVRHLQAGSPNPILVHCAAGVGRTGAIIALDIAIDLYLHDKEVIESLNEIHFILIPVFL